MICIGDLCISWTYIRYYILANYWMEFSILLACGLGIALGIGDVILKRRSNA